MPSQMLQESQEHPQVLQRLLAEGWPESERATAAIRAQKANYVQLAAL